MGYTMCVLQQEVLVEGKWRKSILVRLTSYKIYQYRFIKDIVQVRGKQQTNCCLEINSTSLTDLGEKRIPSCEFCHEVLG